MTSVAPGILWDVLLVPVASDVLGGVEEAEVTTLTVHAPHGLAARTHADVLELAAAHQLRVVDAVQAGCLSQELQALLARARSRRDAAHRAEWSKNGRDPMVAALIGSRPLTGG